MDFGANKQLIQRREAPMLFFLQVQCATLLLKTKPMAFWNNEAPATVSLDEDLPPMLYI